MLATAAPERVARAIESEKRKLLAEMEVGVMRLVVDYYNTRLKPTLETNNRNLKILMDRRTGLFTQRDYRMILSCLHADSRASASEEKLNKAFAKFSGMRLRLTSATDDVVSPDAVPEMPTMEELILHRAERQARRGGARRTARPDAPSVPAIG